MDDARLAVVVGSGKDGVVLLLLVVLLVVTPLPADEGDKCRNELDRPLFCCNNRRARSTELSMDVAAKGTEDGLLGILLLMAPKAALRGIKVGVVV